MAMRNCWNAGTILPHRSRAHHPAASEHLTNLVEGLLDISHVESGVLRISNDTVRIAPFLDQIANMFRPQARRAGSSSSMTARAPARIRADRSKTPAPDPDQPAVERGEVHPRGPVAFGVFPISLVTISIEDSGIGIAPEDRERSSPPSNAATSPRSTPSGHRAGSGDHPGAGAHHGHLAVTSGAGKGTTFTVR
jgi:signal transduction histidine kinase